MSLFSLVSFVISVVAVVFQDLRCDEGQFIW